MANQDWRRGLRPIKNVNGNAPMIEELDCTTAVIYEGAPVVYSASTGLVSLHTSSVFTSAQAKTIVGVAVAPKPNGTGKNKVLVCTDPDQLYIAQHATDSLTTLANVLAKPFFALGTVNSGNGTTLDSECEVSGTGSSTSASSVADLFQAVGIYTGGSGGAINALGDNVALIGRLVFHARGRAKSA